MRAVEEQTVRPCPQCGTEIRADRRFTVWCAACDWNLEPGGRPDGTAEDKGRLRRLRRRLAQQYGEQLFADLGAAEGQQRPGRRTRAGVLAYAIALVVHAVTAALVVSGLWLLVTGWGGLGVVAGLFLLALAWPLRPRLNRLHSDARVLSRSDAPELYALIDEVAAAVGTRGVDTVVVDTRANASVTQLGLRRRLLTLGLPLWEVLTWQQRIALLGHELGHFTNGDTRHGTVVGTAYRSLMTWYYYLAPTRRPTFTEALVNLVYLVPRQLVMGLRALLDLLTSRDSQRSEYLADAAAARAASTEAAVGLMDRLLVTDSIGTTLSREVNGRRMRRPGRITAEDAQGLWEALADHMDSIPESEYERLRRVGERHGHCVDAEHPPTHLRRGLLLRVTPVPPLVTTDAARSERITAELGDTRSALALKIVKDA
ncbi:M48 family metalloprotease [Streptomyces sp. NPDC002766]|uniref:M48 family metallopeptidase n=1 Tax=unclassified Streptomyces TaxID=2593676 RepID=UPI00332E0765